MRSGCKESGTAAPSFECIFDTKCTLHPVNGNMTLREYEYVLHLVPCVVGARAKILKGASTSSCIRLRTGKEGTCPKENSDFNIVLTAGSEI